MLKIFFLIAITNFLADFGDKTQLTIILLTHKTRNYRELFFGVILGFLIANTLGIIAGSVLGHIIPVQIFKVISGITFILFGILSLRNKEEKLEKEKVAKKSPFYLGASLTFLAELGDKTQIATALFATKYNPLFVLFSSMIGLTCVAFVTIYASKYLLKKIPSRFITITSGLLFIAIGILFLLIN